MCFLIFKSLDDMGLGQCGSSTQKIYNLFKMPISQEQIQLDITFLMEC